MFSTGAKLSVMDFTGFPRPRFRANSNKADGIGDCGYPSTIPNKHIKDRRKKKSDENSNYGRGQR